MKKLLLSLICLPLFAIAQQTTHNVTFDGQARKYIQYVPSTYTGNDAVPVVFALHGLGDNMNNFSQVGFHQVADTANFIVITPEALADPFMQATAWNSGAGLGTFILNSNVDDVGFISSIIDSLSLQYNIDPTQVFATGFSMGGFMSNRLACELNDRIAAIASVAGTIGVGVDCQPARAIPTCHFHGTSDATVPYTGNQYGNDAEELFAFWGDNNGCDAAMDSVIIPNTVADGISVTKYSRISNCTDGVETIFYKADSATHTWLYTPVNDIDYTTEIWGFFRDKTHPSPSLTSVNELGTEIGFSIYPNPASSELTLALSEFNNATVTVYNAFGDEVIHSNIITNKTKLNISKLLQGAYILQITKGDQTTSQSFIKK
jgi:polyhydroxybutyrate depolymerase